MYSDKFFINSIDGDQFQEVKLSSLFRMFQEIATAHADKLGVGTEKTFALGQAWILTRMQVEMYRYPRYEETIVIYTYPGDNKSFIFPRYFEVKTKKGELLARCSTLWAIIDLATRKVSLNPFGKLKLPEEHHQDELPLPGKVATTELSLLENRKVRYSEMDMNGHLNNTKYVDYIVDAIPVDKLKENRIKSFLINFNKEIKADDVVNINTGTIDNQTIITGDLNGVNSFSASIVFEKR